MRRRRIETGRWWFLGNLALMLLPGMAASAIPANTWVQMEPKIVQPGPGVSEAEVRGTTRPQVSHDNEEPDYRSFSTLEAVGDKILYFGGGHSGYAGNDVDVFDPSENTWTQYTEEESWREDCHKPSWDHDCAYWRDYWGGSGSPAFLTFERNRPWTYHSYQRSEGASGRLCAAIYNLGLWCYDPKLGDEDGAWEKIAENPSPTDGDDGSNVSIRYDAQEDRWLAFYGAAADGVYELSADGTKWSWIADLHDDANWGEIFAEYSSDHDLWLVNNAGVWQEVTLPGGTQKVITDTPPLSGDLEYAPEIKRFLVLSHNGIQAYDPETDSWRRLYLDGPTPLVKKNALRWDQFERTNDGYFVHTTIYAPSKGRTKHKTWAFRLDSGVLSKTPKECPEDACFGPSYEHGSLQAAIDAVPKGGVVGVEEGTYQQCVSIRKPVTIRALSGRPHFQNALCDRKAILVNHAGDTVRVEGLELSGATGEKAVWHHNGAGTLILRDLKVHDSGMGIFSAPGAASLQIYDSELWGMRDQDELAHFIYGAESGELVVKDTYLHGGTDGHFIKAQSVDVLLENNLIQQERWTDINLIDVWGCGNNRVIGNEVHSANTSHGVHAVGITLRSGGKKPCPVERASFFAKGNHYEKHGPRGWSTFVVNHYGPAGLPDSKVTLEDNVVINAALIKDRQLGRLDVGEYPNGKGNRDSSP